ncbi:MAG: PL29 family lyase N-terminal domain-containing protein [Candidatus Cryptobacteroides sp.]
MKIKNYLIIAAAGLMTLAGVSCTDLSSIEKDLDSLESRVTALETQIKTLNENVTALQALRNATTIKSATHNTAENTWTVELSDGTVLTLNDGVIGEGKTPALSINAEGYWTVDYKDGKGYVLVKDASGNPVKALGTDGKTPVFGVDANGYWTVDYGTGATQVKDASGNPVKASSSDAADSFFEEVKLSSDGKALEIKLKGDTTCYSLPIVADFWFKILDNGNAAAGLYTFARNETKVFSVDSKGVASAVVIAKPSDNWTVILEGATLSITSPAAGTKAVSADSRTDVAILAISEKGFSTTAKISVALNDEPIEVNPAASVSFVSATETTLSFSVTATDFTGCKYVIKPDDTVPTAEEISTSGTAIAFAGSATTATFTAEGLTGETTYKVFVLPYNGDVLGTVVSAEGTTAEKTYTSLYAKWMDGKDIVIDGVAYNKGTWTGTEAVHITTSSESANINANGIYFIDKDVEAAFTFTGAIVNLIIIGDEINSLSTVKMTAGLYAKLNKGKEEYGSFVMKNILLDASGMTSGYSITVNADGMFDKVIFEDCCIKPTNGKPLLYSGGNIRTINKVVFKSCDIQLPAGTAQYMISCGGSNTPAFGDVTVSDCLIYCTTDNAATSDFKVTNFKLGSFNSVTLKGNTFINAIANGAYLYADKFTSVYIEDNIFFTNVAADKYFPIVQGVTQMPTSGVFTNNIGYKSDQTKQWQAFSGGMGNAFEGAVDVKKLTEDPFAGGTFNAAEGKFVPNASYAEYGAKR